MLSTRTTVTAGAVAAAMLVGLAGCASNSGRAHPYALRGRSDRYSTRYNGRYGTRRTRLSDRDGDNDGHYISSRYRRQAYLRQAYTNQKEHYQPQYAAEGAHATKLQGGPRRDRRWANNPNSDHTRTRTYRRSRTYRSSNGSHDSSNWNSSHDSSSH